jgi:hypothetical protein
MNIPFALEMPVYIRSYLPQHTGGVKEEQTGLGAIDRNTLSPFERTEFDLCAILTYERWREFVFVHCCYVLMIKHVNYQIRNIPFLINETENVLPDAPLTNYPGEGFLIFAAKLLFFADMVKKRTSGMYSHTKISRCKSATYTQ